MCILVCEVDREGGETRDSRRNEGRESGMYVCIYPYLVEIGMTNDIKVDDGVILDVLGAGGIQ